MQRGRAVGGYNVPPPPPGSAGGAQPNAWPAGTLDGTCHFGNAQTSLPAWYAQGYLAAPDDEVYNGTEAFFPRLLLMSAFLFYVVLIVVS